MQQPLHPVLFREKPGMVSRTIAAPHLCNRSSTISAIEVFCVVETKGISGVPKYGILEQNLCFVL